MSREMGKSYEVYQIASELNKTSFPVYRRDNRESSWDEIETTPERLELYLPDVAIDFLTSKKVKLYKTPFRKYTLTQIPENNQEDRFIKFPSLRPKEEFKRELMFYMGMLLSSYHIDDPEDEYIIPGEYDDLLPNILEYLSLKEDKREEFFSIKHLNELKKFNKTYPRIYDDYKDFQELENRARFSSISPEKMENFRQLSIDRAYEMEEETKKSVVQLSSLDGALSLIDITKTPDEFKQLIEELMLNKDNDRAQVLRKRKIDSYGYKRLRKEIDLRRKNAN